jgi:beta-lactamase regulating signal transducer with metallopeptidase domain
VESLEGATLTFLFNSVWQAPLLAGLGWASGWLLKRAPAAYRHRLWVCALLLTLLAPLASALKSSVANPPGRPAPGGAAASGAILDGAALGFAAAKRLGLHAQPAGAGLGHMAVMAYFALLLVQSIRLAAGWRRSATLAGRAEEPPPALSPILEECAAAFGRRVPVLVSDEIGVPLTFGVAAPVVVIPARFATHARGEDLRGVLAHELSHVVRRDCAVNFLCELVALPLSYHPAVRFLKRRIGGAREASCDEAAAAFVGPRAYAQTLLDIATRACRVPRPTGALGALDGDSLEDRMKKILETRTPMGRRAATALLAAGVMGLGFAARGATDAAVAFSAEAGPDEMKGHWTAKLAGGTLAGQPAADLTINLTPQGPDIALTLYRYDPGADPKKPGKAELLPVVKHSVEKGVLRFQTRALGFRLRAEDSPSAMEADWQFVIVGKDAGELTVLSNSKLEADKAEGKKVAPPAPPLAMARTAANRTP